MTKLTFTHAKFFNDETSESQSYWKAVTNSDFNYDGKFWYADYFRGKTYCRPSCGSKGNKQSANTQAENTNVTRTGSTEKSLEKRRYIYFRSIKVATESGLSPCKRCNAADLSVVSPKAIKQKAEEIIMTMIFDEKCTPTLTDVAKRLGKSKFHVHRQCRDKEFNIKEHVIKVKKQFYQVRKGEKLKKRTLLKKRVKPVKSAERSAIETHSSHNMIATEDPNMVKDNVDEDYTQLQLPMAAISDCSLITDWSDESSLVLVEYPIQELESLELESSQLSFTDCDSSPDMTKSTLESHQNTPMQQDFNNMPFLLQEFGFQTSSYESTDFNVDDVICKEDDFFNFDCEQ